jgi:hypothetical protein
MKKNMDDFLNEYLFNKKTVLKYDDLKEKIEQEDLEAEETNPVKTEYVFESTLSVNDSEATVRLEKGEFRRRVVTDFVSIITLFKDSKEIPLQDFLTSIGIVSQNTPPPVTPPPSQMENPPPENPPEENSKDTGSKDAISPDESIKAEAEIPTQQPISAEDPIPDNNEKIDNKEFKLASFSLNTKETVSQDNENTVNINGIENINGALSFKVKINSDSSPFNTPESALAYFDKVFFDNIVKVIDREIEEVE